MGFNFPNSPTPGTTWLAPNGTTYIWDGSAWRITSDPYASGVVISDTPPANPFHGMLWWESDSGNTFIYFDDGDSAQWVQFNIAPRPLEPSPFKRTLITASTTSFQFDLTTLTADIEVQGGGGGGGSCPTNPAAGSGGAGAGGGAGGYVKKLIEVTAAVRAATKTITVGAGGAAAGTGGNSSYADTVNTLTANGGAAGSNGSNTSAHIGLPGGNGGASSGGDINCIGSNGEWGIVSVIAGSVRMQSGRGGNSRFSRGGPASGATTGAATGAVGPAAPGIGGGGAGAFTGNGGGGFGGGAGGVGAVIITEYR